MSCLSLFKGNSFSCHGRGHRKISIGLAITHTRTIDPSIKGRRIVLFVHCDIVGHGIKLVRRPFSSHSSLDQFSSWRSTSLRPLDRNEAACLQKGYKPIRVVYTEQPLTARILVDGAKVRRFILRRTAPPSLSSSTAIGIADRWFGSWILLAASNALDENAPGGYRYLSYATLWYTWNNRQSIDEVKWSSWACTSLNSPFHQRLFTRTWSRRINIPSTNRLERWYICSE